MNSNRSAPDGVRYQVTPYSDVIVVRDERFELPFLLSESIVFTVGRIPNDDVVVGCFSSVFTITQEQVVLNHIWKIGAS